LKVPNAFYAADLFGKTRDIRKMARKLIAKVKPAEVMRNARHKNQHDWAKSELSAALKWARASSPRYNRGYLFL
jgi:hypothetical protein